MAQIKIVVVARRAVPGEAGPMQPGTVHKVNDVWLHRGRGRAVREHLPTVDDYVARVSRMAPRALMAECNKRGLERSSEDRAELLALLLDGIAPLPEPLPDVRGAHVPQPEPDAPSDDGEDDEAEDAAEGVSQNETRPNPKRPRRKR